MNRETEEQLIDFCVQQRGNFSSQDWLGFTPVSGEMLASVALFLAAVDWYGHEAELEQVAEALCSGANLRWRELLERPDFETGRFSQMLRTRLTHEQSHA